MSAGVGVQPRRARRRSVGRRRSGGGGPPEGDVARAPVAAVAPAPVAPAPPAPAGLDSDADHAPAGRRRDEATLEQLIGGLWDEVLSEGRAVCPVCGGEMVGRASAHARPGEGRCGDCGTTIG